MVDFYMKCDTRDDSWFEVKGYTVIDGVGQWENTYNAQLDNTCYDGLLSPISSNHKAKCGMMTVLYFGDNYCSVHPIPEDGDILA